MRKLNFKNIQPRLKGALKKALYACCHDFGYSHTTH